MGERRFHHLQVTAVPRQALIVGPSCPSETLRAKAAHASADRSVIEIGVEDHSEDVIEEHQAGYVRLDQLRLTLGHLETGPAVGAGQGLVEETHHLVDDLGMRRSQGSQQDRIAALGGHLAYRPGGRAAGHGGELAEPFGWDDAQIEAVSAEVAQVGQLRHLGLDRLRRWCGRPVSQPHQRRHTKIRVGGNQGVELSATIGVEERAEPAVDLLTGGHPGPGDGPREPVKAGTDDLLSPEALQGLGEQQRGGVVLQGSGDQPVAERLPLAAPTGPPAGLGDHHLEVLTPGAAADVASVTAKRGRGNTDPAGQTLYHLGGGGGQIGRDEAQEAQGAQLHDEAQPVSGGPWGAK